MRVTDDQRRARLARRHLLATPGATPEEAAEAVVALHATDPATVHLSVAARTTGTTAEPAAPETERALYDDRTLVRLLGMRRTMFVVPREVAPVVQAACADDIAAKQRTLLVKHLTENGHPESVPEAAGWLAEVEEATVEALLARGEALGQELAADVPGLRQRLRMAPGKPYEAIGNVTSRVLFLLAAQGRIVRGRPRGTWLSTQYRWSPMDAWLPGGLPRIDAGTARAELARRWLHAYGPAPIEDLRWWTGWTAAQAKKALAAIGPAEVDLEGGGTGLLLPGDLEPEPEPGPWVALLPALDPTPMGWAAREWYLGPPGPHRDALFDRSGNIGPTIWCDGRIAGGWAQRPDGEIAVRCSADVGAEASEKIAAAAARMGEWLGEVRVIPRFRTPLERELSGSS
ncbi:winged helix DNA-binding domain-containing protein [Amycolatopsis magusensis]|uniref:winged helix DNA-binding domain-containing protein n=1 Tax=Amycolatopsis magusensis TaxID=882444 RepID=UPI003C2F5FC7